MIRGESAAGMQADVIISIRPEWWHKILIGRKNVEIRKSFPTRLMRMDIREKNGFTAAVHVSGLPDISGFIHFYEITTHKTRMIIGSGMTEAQFDEYSGGLTVFGWCLDSVQKLKKTIPLEEFGITKPPQSWCYVQRRTQLAAFADRDTAYYADRGALMPAT